MIAETLHKIFEYREALSEHIVLMTSTDERAFIKKPNSMRATPDVMRVEHQVKESIDDENSVLKLEEIEEKSERSEEVCIADKENIDQEKDEEAKEEEKEEIMVKEIEDGQKSKEDPYENDKKSDAEIKNHEPESSLDEESFEGEGELLKELLKNIQNMVRK